MSSRSSTTPSFASPRYIPTPHSLRQRLQQSLTVEMGWGEHLTEVQEDEDIYDPEYEYSSDERNSAQRPEADEEDSDIDADPQHTHGPTTSAEKRKFQNDIFRNFAAKVTEKVTEEEIKERIEETEDELLSIRDILAKQENCAQITNPRDYQTELFQKAKDENIIAVLDTGSGKTHIATMLLRHVLDIELEARAKGAPPKMAFFLVLAHQNVFLFPNSSVGKLGKSRISAVKRPAMRSRPESGGHIWCYGPFSLAQSNLGEAFHEQHGHCLHGRGSRTVHDAFFHQNVYDQPSHFRRSSPRKEQSPVC
jgi:hypothetical protein